MQLASRGLYTASDKCKVVSSCIPGYLSLYKRVWYSTNVTEVSNLLSTVLTLGVHLPDGRLLAI